MNTTKMPEIKSYTAGNFTRLVSFENSNSWIKRHDDEGTLLIQAGYRENPNANTHKDDENPIVIASGFRPRWYGEMACQGAHTKLHGRNKVETAREAFAATLRASDDGRDLIVIASHWDKPALEALKAALTGQYKVTRNGVDIRCTVTQVLPILEGMGSYEAVKDRLQPGSTLLIELGFGTSEQWVIDSKGRIISGATVDEFGLNRLCQSIANDPAVRGLCSDNSGTVNPSLISQALREESIGRIKPDIWKAIKANYGGEFLRSLNGYMRTQFADQSQSISSIVLTGGGASFLQSIQPKVSQAFIIPDGPQTASVRGAYEAQLAKGGAQ